MSRDAEIIAKSLLVIVLFGCVAGLCVTFYDIGLEQGKAAEKSKCGVVVHCAEITQHKGIDAAKYRQFKNCVQVVRSWRDE